jgi:N-acetylglucosaminyldiphosphoundecaprenol N-acetyl-beta-D-mannosaminyltransferase
MQRVELFGIVIHNVTMDEAVDGIAGWLTGSGRHYVTTPNVDHVMRLQRDPGFRQIYRNASLVVADGMPLIWASRWLGKPLKERVSGADLLPKVCEATAQLGKTVFLLGGKDGIAERAARNLQARFPSLRIVGSYGPPVGFESNEAENQRIVRAINEAQPDVLFVCLGAPKQEQWVARYLQQLHIKVALCVGAGIDYAAGTLKRAPQWMQRVGLEWAWRLLQEPGRLWRRYLVTDLAFGGVCLSEWWRLRVLQQGRVAR